MKSENNDSLIKFEMSFISRRKSGMIKEALERAKCVYPYQIERKNILIEETDRKGFYSIAVNKAGFEKQRMNHAKIILPVVLSLSVIFVSGLFIWRQISDKKTEELRQRQIEKFNEEKIMLQKENENHLKELISSYELIEKNKYENIYERIEVIYSLLVPSTTIENLNIDGDSFYIDFTTKNSTGLLSNFETSSAVTGIKMNRTTVLQKDITSISGNFIKHSEDADSNLSIDEKIDFYKTRIEQDKVRKELLLNTPVSAYINTIRTLLHKNNCSEQYVQIKGEKENLEAEILIYSSAENILNFLKKIQSGMESHFDIKSFHLKNSENQQHLQSLIIFKTGISLKENENSGDFEEIRKYSSKEISAALYKTAAVKPDGIVPVKIKKKPVEIEKPKSLRILNYIGFTKMNGRNYVMAKDEEMRVIYRLLLSESETEGDFCMSESNGVYKAKIRNEWFEVKK